ncbi:MAG: hypothetical protein IT531_00085 [Burkholderiales bacterium]|nr:hypothetical protein [Burkholderiales bacterium]
MTYRTLGTLRAIVSARCGFGAQGASIGGNAALIDSWLQNAQAQLYWMQDWKKLQEYDDIEIGIDQTLVDYPDNAHPERILAIAVNIGSGSDLWRPLEEGIRIEHYNTQSSKSYPMRYERYEQIEVWPACDAIRTLRVWYVKRLGAFTAENDAATLDDELILLHATATAKAHYRQPDAATWGSQLEALLARIKGQSFGGRRFLPPGKDDQALLPRPVVI